ncbi:MAG TPA: response regulator transcription factor [Mobilitalea sp.]|nr:response regulator transcription factor [Mobilitalea sp.]
MPKLLLIDDDKEVLTINKKYFAKEGYEVRLATSALGGLKALTEFTADCIVLDVMMPGMNGFQAFQKIKALSKAPVIFLTGRSFEEDKIRGLLLGADDYIIKPYSLRELAARIQVQIRRSFGSVANSTAISYPPLQLDLTKHKAFYNSEEILLSNREYDLLYLLASKPNETVTFEDIGMSMWGTYSEMDRRTIMVTASRLRKKLEDYIGLPEMVETVWSQGYKFVVK